MKDHKIIVNVDYHRNDEKSAEDIFSAYIGAFQEATHNKIKEFEKIRNSITMLESPIEKYGRLIDYVKEGENSWFTSLPEDLFYEVAKDIFSYLKHGAYKMVYGKPCYILEELDFLLSVKEKELEIHYTYPISLEKDLIVDEEYFKSEVTERDIQLKKAMDFYYENDEEEGVWDVYKVLLRAKVEEDWREKTGSKEPWRGQGMPRGMKLLPALLKIKKEVHPYLDEIYENVNEKILREQDKVHVEKKIVKSREDAERKRNRIYQRYHLNLLINAFKDAGFEVKEISESSI